MVKSYICDCCKQEIDADEIIGYDDVYMGETDHSTGLNIPYFKFRADFCKKCNDKFGDTIVEFREKMFKEFGCRKIEED